MISGQIRAKIDNSNEVSKLLANVVCSAYWGRTGVELGELDKLDAENFALTIGSIDERNNEGEFVNFAKRSFR